MSNIIKLLYKMSLDELLGSFNIELLESSRLKYEETEEYEKCALIRDRIKKIKNANNNENIK